MRNVISGLSLALLLLVTACSPKPQSTAVVVDEELRKEINQLTSQFKLEEARSILSARAEAGINDVFILQTYGVLEYKFFQDYVSAKAILERAIRLAPEDSNSHELMGEMYYTQGDFYSAIEALNTAVELSKPADKWDDRFANIYFLIGKAYRALEDTTQAIESLNTSLQYNPYRTETSMILHQLYVEEKEYEKAYETWKLENLVVDGSDSFLARTADYNDMYLYTLANPAGHREWADLYNALHLHEEALLEYSRAAEAAGEDPEIAREIERLEIFVQFRDELALYMEGYYRDRAKGGPDFNRYDDLLPIYSRISSFMGYNQSGSAKSWTKTINELIEKEYGVGLDFVMSSGVYFGLHFGYEADNLLSTISQWGNTGEFRLIVLKNMVSNGLHDWLTEGATAVGGWQLGDNEMYVVMNNGPLVSLVKYLDEEQTVAWRQDSAAEYSENLNRDAAEVFYYPALVTELTAKQVSVELEKAAEAGIDVADTETFVITRFQDSLLATTIIHEGQHALDLHFPSTWNGEHEYRAKMSELAYGDMQYRVLGNLHTQGLDSNGNDKHSSANIRVYQDIVQYILDNSPEFPEINTNQNIMLQLHNLSEEQIRQTAIAIFEAAYPDELYQ